MVVSYVTGFCACLYRRFKFRQCAHLERITNSTLHLPWMASPGTPFWRMGRINGRYTQDQAYVAFQLRRIPENYFTRLTLHRNTYEDASSSKSVQGMGHSPYRRPLVYTTAPDSGIHMVSDCILLVSSLQDDKHPCRISPVQRQVIDTCCTSSSSRHVICQVPVPICIRFWYTSPRETYISHKQPEQDRQYKEEVKSLYSSLLIPCTLPT